MAPWDRQPGESDKAFAAFCAYRDLGPDRTHEKTREKLGKNSGYLRVLEAWSGRFRWMDRAAAFDAELDRQKLPAVIELHNRTALVSAGIQEARLDDYNRLRGLLWEVVAARAEEAKRLLSQWVAFEEKKRRLQEEVDICREALDATDPEEGEAERIANRDLLSAEGKLGNFIARYQVHRPGAGAETGLLVREVKSIGGVAYETWKLDEGLIRQIAALDKQAAEDLGQWLQKMKIDVTCLTDDQLVRLLSGDTIEPMGGAGLLLESANPTCDEDGD